MIDDAVLTRLKHSLQALAAPAEDQFKLFPSYVLAADELALDFDHWRHVVIGQDQGDLTLHQRECLNDLDARISQMTARHDTELWSDSSLATLAQWQEIRESARRALSGFDWTYAPPPSYEHEFRRFRESQGPTQP